MSSRRHGSTIPTETGAAGAGSGDMLAANNLSDVASVSTSRTNLGLGTGDSPQFTAINLGHASDTTLTRSAPGKAALEGKAIPLMDGAFDVVFAGPTAARTYTFPDADGTVTTNAATQTLTNKTLTSPVLTGPTLGTPASGTLTNCTGLPEAGQTLADNTTNDVSTTKHGYVPKAPNDTTKFLRGDATWAVPSSSGTMNSCRVSKSADQSISDNTLTNVSWDTEAFDVGAFHDNVTNNTRLTAADTGKYLVGARISFGDAGFATEYIYLAFYVNGARVARAIESITTDAASGEQMIAYSTLLSLTAGDYVEVQVIQRSGGSVNALSGDASSFWIQKTSA